MENKIKNILLINKLNVTLIILMFFCQIKFTTQQIFMHSKVLQSEKILTVNENGIIIYNQNLEQINQIVNNSQLINSNSDLYYVDISQFLDDENFLIFIRVKEKFYLISDKTNEENKLLFETTNDYNNIGIKLLPYKYYNSSYLIFICYIKNTKLIIDEIKVINNSTGYFLEKNNQLIDETYNFNSCYSCEMMYSFSNFSKIISCFYILNNEPYSLSVSSFYPNSLKKIPELSNQQIGYWKSATIKSTVNKDQTKSLICFTNGTAYCTIFDIDKNKFSNAIHIFDNCLASVQNLLTKFNSDKNEFIISCKTDIKIISIMMLDKNFNIISNNKNYTYCINRHSFNDYYYIISYDLIYQKEKNDYSFLVSLNKNGDLFINETIGECNTNISKINFDGINEGNKVDEIEEENENEKEIEEKNENEKEIEEENEKDNKKDNDNHEYKKIKYYNESDLMKAKTNMTKEIIVKNLDKLLEDIEINKVYQIEGEDFNIIISPINNQSDQKTDIDFSKCENILRNLSSEFKDSIFTIVQIEINNNNEQILNNQIEYAIYDENKNRIDLSLCKNIKINYEIKNTSEINSTLISHFLDKGVDIFNINDDFFNDICYPYSNNKTDVILEDRIADIYQNFSLCESGCEYNQINLTTMKIDCECKVKTVISTEINEPQFSTAVKSTFQDSNINVIKCYKLVFNFSNKKSNIGFFIFCFFIICQIPLLVHFFIFGLKEMKDFISKEMIKNNYSLDKKNESNPINKKKNSLIKIKKINQSNSGNSRINSNQRLTKDNIFPKKSKFLDKALYKDENTKNSPKKQKVYKKFSVITNKIEIKDNDNSSILKKKLSKKLQKNSNKKNKNLLFSLTDKKEVCNCIKYDTLIRFNLNNTCKKRLLESKVILNNYTFNEAIKNDTRNFWRIYWINLINFEFILHTFIFRSSLELKSLRIILFILSNATIFSFNALFYFNNKISDRYNYTGDNLYFYSLINNLVISILSTIISLFLLLLNRLINSRYELENVFRCEEEKKLKNKKYELNNKEKIKIREKIENILKKLKIKIFIFLLIDIILILFYIYFVTAFCAVYKETQISWISDSITSFISTIIIELLISFFNTSLYTSALRYKLKYLYKISIFIYKLR